MVLLNHNNTQYIDNYIDMDSEVQTHLHDRLDMKF